MTLSGPNFIFLKAISQAKRTNTSLFSIYSDVQIAYSDTRFAHLLPSHWRQSVWPLKGSRGDPESTRQKASLSRNSINYAQTTGRNRERVLWNDLFLYQIPLGLDLYWVLGTEFNKTEDNYAAYKCKWAYGYENSRRCISASLPCRGLHCKRGGPFADVHSFAAAPDCYLPQNGTVPSHWRHVSGYNCCFIFGRPRFRF
jgi:hypothetical protein